jgi:CO/xanthine dehydrogenase FAD-binding subunit
MLLDVVKVEQPRSLHDLWRAHEKLSGARVLLAGGTDLLVLGKDGKVPRGTWIDLRRVPELHGIDRRDGFIRLGAMATYSQALRSPLLSDFPAVVQGAREIGSPQIRSRGTFAGNCANASPAGDSLPGLYVHDARLVLTRVGGTRREVPVEDFFLGVRRTLLAPDEIISEIRLPLAPARRSVFLKLGTRDAMAIAKASIALSLRLDDQGHMRDVRLALGAVAPTVLRARQTERLLENALPSPSLFAEASTLAATECTPITDYRSSAPYRRAMISILTRRALATGTVSR